jgi:hypothetical protein
MSRIVTKELAGFCRNMRHDPRESGQSLEDAVASR